MEDFLSGLIANYGHFFNGQEIVSVLTSPESWMIIFWLIILEGLLSCDNALVLAVLVSRLPKGQQRKALFYGIWGAYFFRFVAIGLGTYLIKITWVQIIGAGYLLWMAAKFFIDRNKQAEGEGEEEEAKVSSFWIRLVGPFWATVITVELMDITFSVDSILAAFALSGEVWVLFVGGMLGILMMRGVAGIFIKLLERYPELEASAYVLIAIIGAKLMGQAFGFHVPPAVFFPIMAAVILGTIALHHINEANNKKREGGKKSA